MKFKGIWIAICLILMIGFTSTNYIRKITGSTGDGNYEVSFMPSGQAGLSAEETGPAAADREAFQASPRQAVGFEDEGLKERAPEKKEKGASGDASQKQETAAGQKTKTTQGIPEGQTVPDSGFRLATASEADGFWQDGEGLPDTPEHNWLTAMEEKDAGENEAEGPQNIALVRLQELDSQIARNRVKDTDATANSQKAAAESEWRLWEAELQRMLETLKGRLDHDGQDALMRQQREWIRSREEQAVAASQKQMGSAMEEVSYNRALAELTRERSYQVAEIYESFFALRKEP